MGHNKRNFSSWHDWNMLPSHGMDNDIFHFILLLNLMAIWIIFYVNHIIKHWCQHNAKWGRSNHIFRELLSLLLCWSWRVEASVVAFKSLICVVAPQIFGGFYKKFVCPNLCYIYHYSFASQCFTFTLQTPFVLLAVGYIEVE